MIMSIRVKFLGPCEKKEITAMVFDRFVSESKWIIKEMISCEFVSFIKTFFFKEFAYAVLRFMGQ